MQSTSQTQKTDHAHRRIVKTHEVLKYDLTETSLISHLDSYILAADHLVLELDVGQLVFQLGCVRALDHL